LERCPGDGREVTRATLHRIRGELELDESHGVDSEAFYSGNVVDDFIQKYRVILRTLGRL
jgi:hypothetical protein